MGRTQEQNMNREKLLATARLAGEVVRYHTWPMHHRQTVGEHTWQCMRIYWQIWGPLPPMLTTYFIWHDAGELACGDLPFPVKSINPIIKAEMDELEERAVERMGGADPREIHGHTLFKTRAKACDLIDMHECGLAEVAMGNKFAQPIVDDTLRALERLKLSDEDGMAIFKYLAKENIRCDDTQSR
jgi:hypothetical protein